MSFRNGMALRQPSARRAERRRQVLPRLRPVLRQQDFNAFDLNRAFDIAAAMGKLMI